jgi:hypothetical protein
VTVADIVRDSVAVMDYFTKPAQVDVIHEAYEDDDEFGKPTYAAPVARPAGVTEGFRPRTTATGQVIPTKAHIQFDEPVVATGRDRFTLPSGATGEIVDTDGAAVDPATGATYWTGIWLG